MEQLKQQLEALQKQVSMLVSREKIPESVSQNQALHTSAQTENSRPEPGNRLTTFPTEPQLLTVLSPTEIGNLGLDGSNISTPSRLTVPRSPSAHELIDRAVIGHATASANAVPASGRLAIAFHPLLSFSKADSMRLIDVYEDECGSVYPLIDVENVRQFANRFYDSIAVSINPATWHAFKLDSTSKRHFHTLEIVLAIAIAIENRGSTHLSSALMDELEVEIDHRPSGVCADIHLAEILTLMVCVYLSTSKGNF